MSKNALVKYDFFESEVRGQNFELFVIVEIANN